MTTEHSYDPEVLKKEAAIIDRDWENRETIEQETLPPKEVSIEEINPESPGFTYRRDNQKPTVESAQPDECSRPTENEFPGAGILRRK